MQFTTTVNDECVYGITEARLAYNASLPPLDPKICADNYAYLDFVLTTTIQSWCDQYAYTLAPLPAPPVAPVAVVEVTP